MKTANYILTLSALTFLLILMGCAPSPSISVAHASEKQINHLRSVLESGITISDTVYAVQAVDHNNSWYLGTKIYGAGLEEGVAAVWLVNGDKENPGMMMGADSIASEFTGLPKMSTAGIKIGSEASALRNYVENNIK